MHKHSRRAGRCEKRGSTEDWQCSRRVELQSACKLQQQHQHQHPQQQQQWKAVGASQRRVQQAASATVLVHCNSCCVYCCCLARVQVEIKTTPETINPDVLQKAADFVHAFILGEADTG